MRRFVDRQGQAAAPDALEAVDDSRQRVGVGRQVDDDVTAVGRRRALTREAGSFAGDRDRDTG